MRNSTSILGLAGVLSVALVTGGWFLQRGVLQESNVYLQARLFQEVLDHVTRQFVDTVDRSELIDNAIDGVLEDLGDPHTSFIDAETWERFRFRSGADAEYGGVGLEILSRDGWITVITPLPGGPALRAGIRAGDRIIEVEGVSAQDWETDQAADELRGRPGTDVSIVIDRPGVDEAILFTLTRAVIELLSVPFATILDESIGYIPLQVFSETSGRELRESIRTLRGQGMGSLILDLRNNPGGLLDEGIAVSDLFLADGSLILETKGRAAGQNERFQAGNDELAPELPLVILLNENSASASEIVAGALQDHDRALVIGRRSFGKGSVQTLYRLSGGNILRLTTARWYTPMGRSINISHDESTRDRTAENSTLALWGQRIIKDDLEDGPTVTSIGGRTLHGGGGITPDLLVLPDTLSSREQDAVQRLFRSAGAFSTALFNHSVSYVQNHPDLESGFDLPSADLEHFYRYLVEENEVILNREDFSTAIRFMTYQLEREIALQAWGAEGAFRQTKNTDAQLSKAIEILKLVDTPDAVFRVASDFGSRQGLAVTGELPSGVAGSN